MNSKAARSVDGSQRNNETTASPEERPHRPPMRSGTMFPQSRDESDAAASGESCFLGRYRIVEEIGVGGMASVHLACMDGPGGFQKWVAIKKIHSHLADDASIVQMFFDEARIAARISHPNVATVFDFDKSDTTHWIAMEYLHGEPLREVIEAAAHTGRAIPAEIACRIVADAAEGLHAAHDLVGNNGEDLNLVHRDVNPQNLFVTYEGATKVVDFGIAKFSSRENQTSAGTLKGKIAYMSPEQAAGNRTVDRRTDIFALGVVLWELTTGRRLFLRENDIDTLMSVEQCAIPLPSTIVRGYPSDLEDIVMTALAKNPADRFDTARELSRALQALLMHRDMFVSTDKVASFMRATFATRIQRRDAQLRRASEITPPEGDRRGRSAEVRAANKVSATMVAKRRRSEEARRRPSAEEEPSVKVGVPNFAVPLAQPLPRIPAISNTESASGLPRWAVVFVAISIALLIAGVVLSVIALTRRTAAATLIHERASIASALVASPTQSGAAMSMTPVNTSS